MFFGRREAYLAEEIFDSSHIGRVGDRPQIACGNYTGPITISGYQKFEDIKKQLQNYKIDITAQ